ncbi:acyltransferase family protein [Streptomyces sp. NPDC001262]|uniref:acyltransferase family protein n=1 Tax=Streptomyces sp. NPDC001262 TaxID=3364552 RepID=UPI00368E8BB3
MAQKRPRLAVLDGLRLVAALMVVFCHYTASNDAWGKPAKTLFPELHRVTQYTWVGVEVFFLISGFVICMSSWGKKLGDFVVSRVTRLYPAYWFALILTVTVITLFPEVRQVRSWTDVLVNFTMLQEGFRVHSVDGVYWTLFVEMKFYLLFAIVVWRGVTYRQCVLFCGLWTVASMIMQVAPSDFLDMWTEPSFTPYFVGGIALYLVHRFGPNLLLGGIVLFSFVLAELQVSRRVLRLQYDTTNVHHTIPAWPAQLVVAGAFLFMTLLALGVFNRIQWRWLTVAGAMTYPLYLLHQAIGLAVLHHLRNRVPALPLVLGVVAAMLLLSWLVHRFVERPVSKWLGKAMKQGMADLRRHSDPPIREERSAVASVPPEEPVKMLTRT